MSTHQMEDNTFPNCYNLNSNYKSSMEPESAVTDFAASMETPDLRIWFSSYVYQSPELTSSYCYEDSLPVDEESNKDTGLYVEDSEGEEENARTDGANCPSIFVKNIGADGCSLHESLDGVDQQHKVTENSDSNPSQPPDIRNWFSSYVYESPMLDTAEIGCSLPTTIDTEHDFTHKDTTIDDLIDDKSVQTDVVKRRKLIGCEKSETESAQLEKLSIPCGISCCAEACKDEGNMERIESCYKNSATSKEAAKCEEKASIIDYERDPGWVLPNGRSKQGSSRKKMSANADAKEKKFEAAENVGLMTSRKPLMEITNVCSISGDVSNEIAGKWRCPQKTKPCIGPPLKQLRLDKWIHRV